MRLKVRSILILNDLANVFLGRPMAVDLFSFTQNDTKLYSYMSQCVGLMAELDLWTEHLRFLGNTFVRVPSEAFRVSYEIYTGVSS